jgi:hypothetical protein
LVFAGAGEARHQIAVAGTRAFLDFSVLSGRD